MLSASLSSLSSRKSYPSISYGDTIDLYLLSSNTHSFLLIISTKNSPMLQMRTIQLTIILALSNTEDPLKIFAALFTIPVPYKTPSA